MTKYEKLYNGIIDLLEWAEEQEHITEEANDILQDNLEKFKEGLDTQTNE